MDKFDMRLLVLGSIFTILLVAGTMFVIEYSDEPTKPKNELRIKKNVDGLVVKDTTIVEQKGNKLWPIRVVSVKKNSAPKWVVTTDNGVTYYTDKKPKVGDIAFYINDNDDITDKDGRVEVTRR